MLCFTFSAAVTASIANGQFQTTTGRGATTAAYEVSMHMEPRQERSDQHFPRAHTSALHLSKGKTLTSLQAPSVSYVSVDTDNLL